MNSGLNHIIRKIMLSMLLFLGFGSMLKASDAAQMLRANGKNNAVIAVLAIIFTGLIIWLVRLDRKVSRMEQEQKKSGTPS
ncbi:MAG: CcmD family protein [Bacteroidota bacterium]|jgi:uncharacterized membrane protein